MKKSFALVLALAMSLTGASALAAEKVTVRFGNTAGEDDIQSISLRDVAGRLAEATDGNFDAQVYLSSSLGDTDDLTEQAMQGADRDRFRPQPPAILRKGLWYSGHAVHV